MNRICQNRSVISIVVLAITSWLVLGSGSLTPTNAQETKFNAGQIEFFERKVRPLLADNCYSCHSSAAQKNEGSLLLDSRAAILEGGDTGEAIVAGKPDESLLIGAVNYEDYEMPPKGKLPDDQIAVLEKWVKMGAPWPDEKEGAGAMKIEKFDLEARRKEHWVWQPVVEHPNPTVESPRWSETSIDQFIHAKLTSQQLEPTQQAEPLAIARRLFMDLIGLPPTTDQLAEFQNDLASGRDMATEKLVDRLLASEHFGERWGRHWLDLTRYAESYGHEFDIDIGNAFQYRDYVIRAFNADIPYDQLIREHIAGDLLDDPRLHPQKEFNESILGTGFWFLGESIHSPVDIRKEESDRFDNMIDVATKSFLGVTVSCARCHDHKFDAISTADYYSLTGFLHSSDYRQVRFESIHQNKKVAAELNKVNRRYRDEISKLLQDQEIELPERIDLTDERIVFDFAALPQSQYMQDGFIFGDQVLQAGRAYFLSESESPEIGFTNSAAAINDPFWNRLDSVNQGVLQDKSKLSEIPKSGRTLRTPTFELKNGKLSCFVAGKGHVIACVDSHRLIMGPLHGETIKEFDHGSESKWVQLNLKRYVNHRLHLEFVPEKDQQVSIILAAQGLSKKEQKRLTQKLKKYEQGFTEFAKKAESSIADQETGISEVIKQWQSERKRLSAQLLLSSRLAPAMMDGTGEEANVYIRGNASKLGKIEPRHFLTAVDDGQAMEIGQGSGRLQLAEKINDPNNPLTSRVIVNRIWHYLMGRGLVPTTDDFGVLGQRPTHPKLLDHLASEFVADGQSIKRMIKRIVLSQTYQLASRPDSKSLAADPKNLLWHHRPPKRLEGEAIRDTLLALSGELDKTQEGPPVPVHLTKFMEGRGRPKESGPLDGGRRRSIYVAVRRNFLSPFMTTFDTPAPFSTMGRRNVSNVPAQALILMNDPFVAGQAKKWAERALAVEEDSEKRILWMYESAFGRPPTKTELEVSSEFVGSSADVETWTHFAHALINTKEFIFLR